MSTLLLKSPQSLPTSPPPRASAGPASFVFLPPTLRFHKEPVRNWLQALPLPTPLPHPLLPVCSSVLHASHRSLYVPAWFSTRARGGGIQQVCGDCQGVPGGKCHRPVGSSDLDVRVRAVDLRDKRFSQSCPRCYPEIMHLGDCCLWVPSGERVWSPSLI